MRESLKQQIAVERVFCGGIRYDRGSFYTVLEYGSLSLCHRRRVIMGSSSKEPFQYLPFTVSYITVVSASFGYFRKRFFGQRGGGK